MAPTRPSPPIVALVGATAAGKSDLAVRLAERLGGEVVNTDAMQVYRGMDIGTAKLPPAERRGVPHHLLDILDLHETASVAEFQRLARAVVARLRSAGRVPVLVGGSALYTHAVLDRMEFPGTDPGVRARLEAELEAEGPAMMHRRLTALDPEAAARIEPGNGRRIVRALEVGELTGGPFRAELPAPEYVDPATVQIGLAAEREVLDARIQRRVVQMWADGLVAEVRRLAEQGLAETRTAGRAIGYRPVLALLAGEIDEAEAQRRTAAATRRFVRRQEAWLRRDRRIRWLDHDDPDLLEKAVEVVHRTAGRASVH